MLKFIISNFDKYTTCSRMLRTLASFGIVIVGAWVEGSGMPKEFELL
jgi:hypothetical protein